jgi:hypothetical protein
MIDEEFLKAYEELVDSGLDDEAVIEAHRLLQEQYTITVAPAADYTDIELAQAIASTRRVRLGLNAEIDGGGGLVTVRERELVAEHEKRVVIKEAQAAANTDQPQ